MAQWLSWLERRPVTAEVAGSSPAWVVLYGILAQLGEHLPYKQRVIGSNPVPATYAQIAQLVYQRTENPRVAGSIPALGMF